MNDLLRMPSSVPILGQPKIDILGSYPTVIVRCSCAAQSILVLLGTGSVVPCPACQRPYTIMDEMNVKVGMGMARPVDSGVLV